MAARGTLDFGPGATLTGVRHATLPHAWKVWEVLEHWVSPLEPGECWQRGEKAESYRLLVSGPLPGNPVRRGRFVMVAERYGGKPWWRLTVG